MTIRTTYQKVYAARSLEEAKQILLSAEKVDLENILKRIFIILWLLLANCLLFILRIIFFQNFGLLKKEFQHIVIYTVGIVGDNVVMLPALAAIRRRYKDAKITLITNCQIWDKQGAKELLEASFFKDRLIILNDHPVQRHGFNFTMDSEKFKEIGCDLFVNLSPFGNRGWFGVVVREMIFAKKLGAEYAIGFQMSTYSRKSIFNRVQHYFIKNEPRRSERILNKIGLSPAYNEDLLPMDKVARESVMKKLHGYNVNESLFVINPGGKFRVQCWPEDRFGMIANYIAKEHHASVILTGVASERKIADNIKKESAHSVINLAGETTVTELVELLRLARACITNDTGTMHISAMVGIPTVALFTVRLSPTHWLPVGKRVISIFSLKDCKYCYDNTCQTKECLNAIEVEDIIEVLEEILSESK
jgi:ADP-heptose:LPS heptosyltransferase